MALGQLYYTSCLTGLAGAPGFQFNAASPGIAPEVMRDAEALTTYRAPRELALLTGTDEVRDAPRNLCYRYGPVTLIANVVYVGLDYSQRPGNFFAHTLVSRDPDHDLGDRLPIDLWRSPFWTTTPADTTRLAELPAPPPAGPLDEVVLGDFLAVANRGRFLPALLTAADDAVQGGQRKLVIVAGDADEVAAWLGVLSRLLPPATARRMSFATYQHDPRYSRVHVVGTLRGEAADFDLTGHHTFHTAEGRISDIAVHPLAVLLTGLGLTTVRQAWRHAETVATGGERSLDDWLPVLATVLMAHFPEVGAAGQTWEVVAPWLAEHGSHLPGDVVERVGDRALALLASDGAPGDRTLTGLGFLARAADQSDLPDLLERVECGIVDVLLAQARAAPVPPATPMVPLRTAPARRHAETTIVAALPSLPAPATAGVLRWVTTSGIRLPEPALRQAGRQVGPALLRTPDDQTMRTVLAASAPVRAGVVEYLNDVGLAELDRMVEALRAGLDEDLRPELDRADPAVQQVVAVAAVRAGRLDAVEALRTLGPEADDRLLALLLPDDPWPPALALRVLNLVNDRALAPPVLGHLEQAVIAWPPPQELPEYTDLCLRLADAPLAAPARLRAGLVADVHDWPARITEVRRERRATVREDLRQWFSRLAPREQGLADALLLLRSRGEPSPVRGELIVVRPGMRRAYCAEAAAALHKHGGDLTVAAEAMRTLRYLQMLKPSPMIRDAVVELERVLRRTVGRWGSRRQEQLLRAFAADGRTETEAYARTWFRQSPPGLLDRLRGRRRQQRSPGSAADDSQSQGRRV